MEAFSPVKSSTVHQERGKLKGNLPIQSEALSRRPPPISRRTLARRQAETMPQPHCRRLRHRRFPASFCFPVSPPAALRLPPSILASYNGTDGPSRDTCQKGCCDALSGVRCGNGRAGGLLPQMRRTDRPGESARRAHLTANRPIAASQGGDAPQKRPMATRLVLSRKKAYPIRKKRCGTAVIRRRP